jgi:hypothetical protein
MHDYEMTDRAPLVRIDVEDVAQLLGPRVGEAAADGRGVVPDHSDFELESILLIIFGRNLRT